jgi:hypothetical protein
MMTLVIVIAALFGTAYGWYRYRFPYGFNHCCLKQLGMALNEYAMANGGHYPAGAGCPEASLSLLYRMPEGANGHVLAGKTKSGETAEEILKRGGLLGPDTCDWHYVEGLTFSDDGQLALVWDKIGLGHDGQRLSGGGHSIWRLHGGEEVIPGSEWPKFLEEQERLMAARTEAAKKGLFALSARIRLPTGAVVDHYDGPYSLYESYTFAGGSVGGSNAGPKLDPLQWRRLYDDSTYTFILSFNGWKSKPVEVKVSHGKATPDSIIFEMQAEK